MKHFLKHFFFLLLLFRGTTTAFAQTETYNTPSNFWKIKGNNSTVPGTHFLGTTDQVDLVLKTNSLERFRISSAGYAAINALPTANDYLYVYRDTTGPLISNVYAVNSASGDGTAWSVAGVAGIIKAYALHGNPYSAAIAGYSPTNDTGSAAVMGGNSDGTGTGFLSYYNGTTRYGIYTTGTTPASIGGNLELYKALMPDGDPGYSGQVLTSAGPGLPPVWVGTFWKITGNAGITASNFLGSKNDADVIFKRNNLESFRITTGGAIWATGDSATAATPTSGYGTRMMWIPQKNAFRAGFVSGTQWDNANIGLHSFATGKNTIASNTSSFTAGEYCTTTGKAAVGMGQYDTVNLSGVAVAIGVGNNQTGQYSWAFGQLNYQTYAQCMQGGYRNVTTGNYSMAIGYTDTANVYSTALGYKNKTSNTYAIAMGSQNVASGVAAIAFGRNNTTSGTSTFVAGEYNNVQTYGGAAIGQYDTIAAPSASSVAFGVGNRITNNYCLAFGQLNYQTNLNCLQGGYRNVSNGAYSIAIGYADTVNAYATAFGYRNNATGSYSHAAGSLNVTTGIGSLAFGQGNTATGQSSFAAGDYNIASGTYAFAVGYKDTTGGKNAQTMGGENSGPSYSELVAGSYATRYTAMNGAGFDRRDRLFNVGNGTGPATANRSDAFTILKNGKSGFSTSLPKSRADINGDLALRQKTLSLSTGVNSDIAFSVDTMSFYRITGPGGAFSITGFAGGVDGKVLILYNTTGQDMTITNLATSSAANQIKTQSGNLTTTGEGTVTLIYDAGSSKWMVMAFTP